jgi:hypothetical protein
VGVASVLWVLLVGGMTWQTWPAHPIIDPFDEDRSTLPDAPWVKGGGTSDDLPDAPWVKSEPKFDPLEYQAFLRREALVRASYVAVAPPVAVFILGLSLLWVVRGFRSEQG